MAKSPTGLVTRDDLDLTLAGLGWTLGGLCRRLGLHRNTPSRWDDKLPRYVVAYMEMVMALKRSRDDLDWFLNTASYGE